MIRRLLRRGVAAGAVVALTVFGSPADAVTSRGPYWTDVGLSTHFGVVIYDGSSARCGPDALGEGWHCDDDSVRNQVDYTAYVDCSACSQLESMRVELRLWNGTSSTLLSDYTESCSPWNDCSRAYRPYPSGFWRTWYGRVGGYLQGRVVVTYRDASGTQYTTDDTGWIGESIEPALRDSEIVNEGPRATPLITHHKRLTPEDVRAIPLTLFDKERHNVEETLFALYDPNGDLVTSYVLPKAKSTPQNDRVCCDTGAVVTPPFAMPHLNGVYTIRTHARDASETATAWGDEQEFAFSYVWNTAPGTPQQDTPQSGDTVVAGAPIMFTVRTSDPENDTYTPQVTVTGSSGTYTATGVPTASGEQGVAVLTGLPPGPYTWTAAATDSNGWTSAPSASRTLIVGG